MQWRKDVDGGCLQPPHSTCTPSLLPSTLVHCEPSIPLWSCNFGGKYFLIFTKGGLISKFFISAQISKNWCQITPCALLSTYLPKKEDAQSPFFWYVVLIMGSIITISRLHNVLTLKELKSCMGVLLTKQGTAIPAFLAEIGWLAKPLGQPSKGRLCRILILFP